MLLTRCTGEGPNAELRLRSHALAGKREGGQAGVRWAKRATWKSPPRSQQPQLILDVPAFFRPGRLQFRCLISSLITARQFSLDRAYFILLGQWDPAIGVLGYAMP